jgi:Mg2+ and Co2+ transporter CorA
MKRINYSWKLPPEILKRLGNNTYGRQRVIHEVDHILIILHKPPSPDSHERESVVFLYTPAGEFVCNGKHNGKNKLLELIEEYRALYDSLDARFDEANELESLFEIIKHLTPLTRAANNMAQTMQAAREILKDNDLILTVRDESHDIARAIELLFHDAKATLDYRIALHLEAQTKKTQQIAQAQHKLNILAAFTFPLMALATLFGANLHHGLEGLHPVFFVVFVFIALTIGNLVKMWVSKE